MTSQWIEAVKSKAKKKPGNRYVASIVIFLFFSDFLFVVVGKRQRKQKRCNKAAGAKTPSVCNTKMISLPNWIVSE